MMAKSVIKQLNYYFDLRFLLKFISFFLVFYYVNIFFVQLTLPGKWHSDFFVEHLNYIGWLTGSLTHTANFITHTLGLNTIVEGNDKLALAQGPRVVVKWQCIGLGIISFWLAFVLAQDIRLKKKLLLGLAGTLAVWFMNCCRIALLVFALDRNLKPWKKNLTLIGGINHHDLFNYGCYAVILFSIFIYYKISVKKGQAGKSAGAVLGGKRETAK
jgi:exosortase/archaeosortase family protein